MDRPWSRAEVLALYSHVGSANDAKLRRVFSDRTEAAVRAKAYRVFGSTSRIRGTQTLASIIDTTGFGRSQLLRAQRALNQRWQRTNSHGAYMITLAQVDEIVDWLKHDYWCRKYKLYACLWCLSEERAHHGRGLCVRCTHQYRRLSASFGLPPGYLAQERIAKRCRGQCNHATLRDILVRMTFGLALSAEQLGRLAGLKDGVNG